jgi:hypothetical protein
MIPATLPPLFVSREALRAAFVAGLERQVAEPGLGTYILALANASFDAEIWPLLRQPLADRYSVLRDGVAGDLRAGRRLDYPVDDLLVFLKLMAMGLDALASTERRPAGPWEIQFNPLRALRPARASGVKAVGVRPPPFDPDGFHFNRPFLAPEILWEGNLLRHRLRLLYNKFPFAPLHGLLVPEPEQARPQLLDQEMHLFAWHLAEALGGGLEGLRLGYNSYGAHASVNHLHFQFCVGHRPLPVEATHWRHNGGDSAYPCPCLVFAEPLEAWFHLDRLHQDQRPYNLLYAPGRLYCLPRRPQGDRPTAPWSGGHAWYEMAGGVTAFNRDDFRRLAAAEVAAELAAQAAVDP